MQVIVYVQINYITLSYIYIGGFMEDNKDSLMDKKSAFITGVWSERVLVITEDYEIKGYVFMPKTGRKNRLLSDISYKTSLIMLI